MKINSVYISAFGTVNDLKIDFSENMNVIYGDNENGKSTVSDFIKAVFYGMNNRSRNTVSNREKYVPWSGKTMGGRITFTHGETEYMIEREFKSSDSSDRVLLRNLDSGEEIKCEKNIGPSLFGLSEAAFERSVFIDNETAFIYDSAGVGDINDRLSSAQTTGDTEISKEKIIKNLTANKLKMLTKTGRGGTLPGEIEQLKILNERFEEAKQKAERKTVLGKTLEEQNEKLKSLLNRYSLSKAIVDRQNDAEKAKALGRFIEIKDEIAQIDNSLKLEDGGVVTESFIRTLDLGLKNYSQQSERTESIKAEIETAEKLLDQAQNLNPEEAKARLDELTLKSNELAKENDGLSEKIETLNKEIEDIKGKPPKTSFNKPTFWVGYLLLFAASVLKFLVNKPLFAVITAVVAGIIIIVSVIYGKKSAKDKAYKKTAELQQEISDLREKRADNTNQNAQIVSEISVLSGNLQASRAVLEEKQKEISAKKEILFNQMQKCNQAKSELIKYFSKFKQTDNIDEICETALYLQNPLERKKELKIELSVIVGNIGDVDYDEAKKRLDLLGNGQDDTTDFEAEKQKLNDLNEQISATKQRITAAKTELTTAFADFVSPDTISRQLKESREEIESKAKFCTAVELAQSLIEESVISMRKNYGKALEEKTSDYFRQLTSGKYNTLNVTSDMSLSAEQTDNFGMRSVEVLSKGTIHQAYISLRLAITSLLSGQEPLPVLLDDSLSQFDDKRTETALDFLNEYSKQNQVLFFTCHGFITEKAEQKNMNVIKPFN